MKEWHQLGQRIPTRSLRTSKHSAWMSENRWMNDLNCGCVYNWPVERHKPKELTSNRPDLTHLKLPISSHQLSPCQGYSQN